MKTFKKWSPQKKILKKRKGTYKCVMYFCCHLYVWDGEIRKDRRVIPQGTADSAKL